MFPQKLETEGVDFSWWQSLCASQLRGSKCRNAAEPPKNPKNSPCKFKTINASNGHIYILSDDFSKSSFSESQILDE